MPAAGRFFLSVNRLSVQCLKAKALGHGSGIIFRNFTLSQTTIALPAVLKAVNGILTSLSAGKEIKVVFAGTPCTDGKTVYLGEPLLQSEDALDAYLSHGTHEIHHVLYSDFDEVASLGGLHSLVNALEDVRIDAIGYKKYPGRSEERRVGKECRSRWSPYH